MAFIFSCDNMIAQHYYLGDFKTLYSIDRNNCQVDEVFKMDASYGEFIGEIAFHPNGRMYASTQKGLLEIDPVTWNMISFLPWNQIIPPSFYYYLFFDENGVGWISAEAGTGPGGRYESHIYFYDARDQKVLQDKVYPRSVFADALGMYGKIGQYYFNSQNSTDKFRLLDLETMTYVTVADWPEVDEDGLFAAAIEYGACQDTPLLLTTGTKSNRSKLMTFNVQTGEILFPCENQELIKLNGGAEGTTTDFRQSALRIDLDADNSSNHITAGYYDTLTTCRLEVPLMDDDIEISTCGAEVDYISFRLKYFDNPRLQDETIYSEDFPGQLVQTSPDRYVWQNAYGGDENKIKEYLRSLRYRADPGGKVWTKSEERERVVMITMHVGEDSTTSWSVYQLDSHELFEGRDTTITYCSMNGAIDLVNHLSPDASPDGRLEPSPARGGTVIDADVDQEEEYLYIVEKGDCADTAVIRIHYIRAPENPETVIVCPGEGLWYNLPPASYSEIAWWDGSHEDSIWIEVSRDTLFYVETVLEDSCSWIMTVPVRVSEVTGLAGEDQTLTFCAGDPEVDLNDLLPAISGMDQRLEPALSNGDLIFQPGVDTAEEYSYILSVGSCADTALITMEESEIAEIPFDSVRLCGGSDVKVGLPPGVYQNIQWWNGDSGDSTTVSSGDTGPFTVEALQSGCTYQGEVSVTEVAEVVLPGDYPDRITLCAGDSSKEEQIPVSGLDSVLWVNRILYPGEEITVPSEGDHTLRGYRGGCFSEKIITVEELVDPSGNYQKTIEWCGRSPLTLTLPEDDADWRFRWTNGSDSTSRIIDSTGQFPFLIRSDSCEYTGFYEVIPGMNCDDECTVSLPNAITPNGDGVNDNLEVFSTCDIRVTAIRIFDKWGGEQYHVQGGEVEPGVWNHLPPGVVMVQVDYEDAQGTAKTLGRGVLVIK